jgi:hypothetical protein
VARVRVERGARGLGLRVACSGMTRGAGPKKYMLEWMKLKWLLLRKKKEVEPFCFFMTFTVHEW